MESLGGVVMKKRQDENSVGPFGFNKKINDTNDDTIKTDEC